MENKQSFAIREQCAKKELLSYFCTLLDAPLDLVHLMYQYLPIDSQPHMLCNFTNPTSYDRNGYETIIPLSFLQLYDYSTIYALYGFNEHILLHVYDGKESLLLLETKTWTVVANLLSGLPELEYVRPHPNSNSVAAIGFMTTHDNWGWGETRRNRKILIWRNTILCGVEDLPYFDDEMPDIMEWLENGNLLVAWEDADSDIQVRIYSIPSMTSTIPHETIKLDNCILKHHDGKFLYVPIERKERKDEERELETNVLIHHFPDKRILFYRSREKHIILLTPRLLTIKYYSHVSPVFSYYREQDFV